jgi:hypothetical protein
MDTTNWISAIVAMILLTFDIHRGRDLLVAGLMVAGQTQRRNLPILLLGVVVAVSCSRDYGSDVPTDFLLIVDTQSAADATQHINIQIKANGQGQYERYDTGGVIRGDLENMVTYEASQVVETGEFNLNRDELKNLWRAIEDNHIFELTGDYRSPRGFSYAFIMIEADGRKHQVFNIGMEVPEIKAMVEATGAVLPVDVKLEYREGYLP